MKKLFPLFFAVMAESAYAEPHYYLGISGGMAGHSTKPSGSDVKLNGNDAAFGVRVGYVVSENASLEMSYKNFGEGEDEIDDSDLFMEVQAANLGVKVFVPTALGFDAIGRVGVSHGDYTLSSNEEGDEEITDDAVGLYFGFGADLELAENIYTGVELNFYRYEFSASDGDSYDIDHTVKEVAVNLGYRF